MNSFEQMGEAQLLAQEGNRELARALLALLKRVFLGMVMAISRSSPGPFVP